MYQSTYLLLSLSLLTACASEDDPPKGSEPSQPTTTDDPTFDSDADGDGFDSLDAGGTDCDDTSASVHPGASDSVGDGVDQDCDGTDGVDADGDGHANMESGGNDCDDGSAGVHPGADEVCDSGQDEDCDGQQWNSTAYYADADGDGFGDPDAETRSCGEAPPNHVLDRSDCDDRSNAIRPDAVETCDGVDENCDGVVDESLGEACRCSLLDETGCAADPLCAAVPHADVTTRPLTDVCVGTTITPTVGVMEAPGEPCDAYFAPISVDDIEIDLLALSPVATADDTWTVSGLGVVHTNSGGFFLTATAGYSLDDLCYTSVPILGVGRFWVEFSFEVRGLGAGATVENVQWSWTLSESDLVPTPATDDLLAPYGHTILSFMEEIHRGPVQAWVDQLTDEVALEAETFYEGSASTCQPTTCDAGLTWVDIEGSCMASASTCLPWGTTSCEAQAFLATDTCMP